MPATDLLEDDSEIVLDDSDYKMLKREETLSTPRVKKVLASSRYIFAFYHIRRFLIHHGEGSHGDPPPVPSLWIDAFVNIQGEQSSFAD
eukprot:scaffold23514_cov55-Attheya_sp.AAC.1